MPKKGKKKAQVVEDDPEVKIIMKVEIIYEDTKPMTRDDLEFKWGQVYQMIKYHTVRGAGLEDIPIYTNIKRSAIMKASTCPELFPCSEVIGWILPRIDIVKMILADVNGQGFVAYSPTYVAQACKLPVAQMYLTEKWLKELELDFFDCIKKMMSHGKQFCTNPTREYETKN